jgi:hypothetical protein
MPTERTLPSDISERVQRALGRETLGALSSQQEREADALINKVAREEGPEALTHERLLGIKDFVAEHLWDPAFNGLV